MPSQISIHALLAESDPPQGCFTLWEVLFLSTLSLRRATREPTALRTPHHKFLSTLSLRRATLTPARMSSRLLISIHALLAESDVLRLLGWLRVLISIHALLAESDFTTIITICIVSRFLSTLSLRRATPPAPPRRKFYKISIHALLAESDRLYRFSLITLPISIHALLAESDLGREEAA